MERNLKHIIVGLGLIVMAGYYGVTTGNYIIGALLTIFGFFVAYYGKYKKFS